jgi:hypothetical protein
MKCLEIIKHLHFKFLVKFFVLSNAIEVTLIDLEKIVHMQVIVQPIFCVVELLAGQRWSNSNFISKEYSIGIGKMKSNFNLFRIIWRTIFVTLITVLAMAMPFFNEMLALLGAIGYWPLTIFFPIAMFIAKEKIKRPTIKWFGLQTLNFIFMLVSLVAAIAAIHGFNEAFHKYKPFMYKI